MGWASVPDRFVFWSHHLMNGEEMPTADMQAFASDAVATGAEHWLIELLVAMRNNASATRTAAQIGLLTTLCQSPALAGHLDELLDGLVHHSIPITEQHAVAMAGAAIEADELGLALAAGRLAATRGARAAPRAVLTHLMERVDGELLIEPVMAGLEPNGDIAAAYAAHGPASGVVPAALAVLDCTASVPCRAVALATIGVLSRYTATPAQQLLARTLLVHSMLTAGDHGRALSELSGLMQSPETAQASARQLHDIHQVGISMLQHLVERCAAHAGDKDGLVPDTFALAEALLASARAEVPGRLLFDLAKLAHSRGDAMFILQLWAWLGVREASGGVLYADPHLNLCLDALIAQDQVLPALGLLRVMDAVGGSATPSIESHDLVLKGLVQGAAHEQLSASSVVQYILREPGATGRALSAWTRCLLAQAGPGHHRAAILAALGELEMAATAGVAHCPELRRTLRHQRPAQPVESLEGEAVQALWEAVRVQHGVGRAPRSQQPAWAPLRPEDALAALAQAQIRAAHAAPSGRGCAVDAVPFNQLLHECLARQVDELPAVLRSMADAQALPGADTARAVMAALRAQAQGMLAQAPDSVPGAAAWEATGAVLSAKRRQASAAAVDATLPDWRSVSSYEQWMAHATTVLRALQACAADSPHARAAVQDGLEHGVLLACGKHTPPQVPGLLFQACMQVGAFAQMLDQLPKASSLASGTQVHSLRGGVNALRTLYTTQVLLDVQRAVQGHLAGGPAACSQATGGPPAAASPLGQHLLLLTGGALSARNAVLAALRGVNLPVAHVTQTHDSVLIPWPTLLAWAAADAGSAARLDA